MSSGLARPTPSELDRLKDRDPAAWSALFEREHRLVYGFVLARVGEPAVADDIAGQVFLEAIEGIGRYRDKGKPISSWLFTIARHRTLDYFRRRGRERGESIQPSVAGPDAELREALEALSMLSVDQREVVHLRFVEGYRMEEVAVLTGRTVGAVKALQHRAILKLRTILKQGE